MSAVIIKTWDNNIRNWVDTTIEAQLSDSGEFAVSKYDLGRGWVITHVKSGGKIAIAKDKKSIPDVLSSLEPVADLLSGVTVDTPFLSTESRSRLYAIMLCLREQNKIW